MIEKETATAKYIISITMPYATYYDVIYIDNVVDCGDYYEVTGNHTTLFIDKKGCKIEMDSCDGIVKSLRNDSIYITLML